MLTFVHTLLLADAGKRTVHREGREPHTNGEAFHEPRYGTGAVQRCAPAGAAACRRSMPPLPAAATSEWHPHSPLAPSHTGVHTAAAAQASDAAAPAPASAAGDLIEWVEGSGGSVSGVAVTRDGAGFGLQAAQGCSAGSTLIDLPQRCHLTYDVATDPRLLALIEQVPAELWGAKLALQVRRVAGHPPRSCTQAAFVCLHSPPWPGILSLCLPTP